jgi:hypothetical protein
MIIVDEIVRPPTCARKKFRSLIRLGFLLRASAMLAAQQQPYALQQPQFKKLWQVPFRATTDSFLHNEMGGLTDMDTSWCTKYLVAARTAANLAALQPSREAPLV